MLVNKPPPFYLIKQKTHWGLSNRIIFKNISNYFCLNYIKIFFLNTPFPFAHNWVGVGVGEGVSPVKKHLWDKNL